MRLSEYQSKELVAQYGVTIPAGRVAITAEEAEARCREIAATKYAVKAQISAGGRGLAGGVKFAATPTAVRDAAQAMLGRPLVTEQTGPVGEIVERVYVEASVEDTESVYVAIALDPKTAKPILLASRQGGVDFERAARSNPSIVDTLVFADEAETHAFLRQLGLSSPEGAAALVGKALEAFLANEMSFLEINPLALDREGVWIALDAKVTLDPSATFRHAEHESLPSMQALSPAERTAQEHDINFVKLDGNIGIITNGAGLGLAINDMVVDAGGKPANFMDIRTTATSLQIAKGIELLLDDPGVTSLLMNIHGGGMTACDTVAEAATFAYARADRKLPMAVRLAGQNDEWALRMLKDRKLPVHVCADMSKAVSKALSLSTGSSG